MQNLNYNEIEKVKNSDKAILLIWTEGCEACVFAKELYETLPNIYNNFEYYKMQFSENVLPVYKKLVQDEIIFPSFLIFDKRNIEEGNELGFVGNISGLDVPYLKVALDSVSN